MELGLRSGVGLGRGPEHRTWHQSVQPVSRGGADKRRKVDRSESKKDSGKGDRTRLNGRGVGFCGGDLNPHPSIINDGHLGPWHKSTHRPALCPGLKALVPTRMHTMRTMHESTKVTVLSFLTAKLHRQRRIVQFLHADISCREIPWCGC